MKRIYPWATLCNCKRYFGFFALYYLHGTASFHQKQQIKKKTSSIFYHYIVGELKTKLTLHPNVTELPFSIGKNDDADGIVRSYHELKTKKSQLLSFPEILLEFRIF